MYRVQLADKSDTKHVIMCSVVMIGAALSSGWCLSWRRHTRCCVFLDCVAKQKAEVYSKLPNSLLSFALCKDGALFFVEMFSVVFAVSHNTNVCLNAALVIVANTGSYWTEYEQQPGQLLYTVVSDMVREACAAHYSERAD